MKNIATAALMAAMALSLAACDPPKKPGSTSTTEIDTTTTQTTASIDSPKTDSAKVSVKAMPGKKSGGALSNTSMRAMKDSIKKDSAKLSRK